MCCHVNRFRRTLISTHGDVRLGPSFTSTCHITKVYLVRLGHHPRTLACLGGTTRLNSRATGNVVRGRRGGRTRWQ